MYLDLVSTGIKTIIIQLRIVKPQFENVFF